MTIDPVRVAEANFDFGWVNVDVDLLGRDLEVEKRHGHPADHEQAAIGFVESVRERAVTDIAAGDKEELPFGGRAALRRMTHIAPELNVVQLALDPKQRLSELAAKKGRDPLAGARGRGQVVHDLVPRAVRHVNLGVGQRDPREHVGDMAAFRHVRFEKRPAHGGVVKEIPNFHHGARRAAAVLDGAEDASFDQELGPFGRSGLTSLTPQLGNLGDGR